MVSSETRPRLIGIAGPSCAGKSEVAQRVAAALAAPVISLDSYYTDLGHIAFQERERANFDAPDALDRKLLAGQLAKLAECAEIRVPVYDFARHVRAAETRSVRAATYAVVEGLFALYWEDVRRLFHTKVFIQAEDAVCFKRRLERDVMERGRTPESVHAQYRNTVRPMAELHIIPTSRFADLVLSGTDPVEQSVEAVLAHVLGDS